MNAIFNLQKATEAAPAPTVMPSSRSSMSRSRQRRTPLPSTRLSLEIVCEHRRGAICLRLRSAASAPDRTHGAYQCVSFGDGELCVRTQGDTPPQRRAFREERAHHVCQFGNAFDPAGGCGFPCGGRMLRAYTELAGSAFENMLGAAREIIASSLSAATDVLQNQLAQPKPPRSVKKAA